MSDKAIIVGVNVQDQENFDHSMIELANLAQACEIEVIERVDQNLDMVNRALYMGTGKVEEVKNLVQALHADLVIFNNELSPSQLRNLQQKLDIPILDRTALILEIFAKRARTKEAKLQVEVAKLRYMLPRLIGLHASLGRQGGSAGVSNKGSGEKKLELDRRRIEDKITELNKELKELEKDRQVQRKQRSHSGLPLVSLVGYTNAGKSTLMNALVDTYIQEEEKKVLEEDMLFATLDTSVRKMVLENKKAFLLSDTVGFISGLPHSLVKAFRSTLEEIKEADLLLHVIDYSDPNSDEYIEVTKQTLQELGAQDIPTIYVYNKADKMLDILPVVDGEEIYMSAKTKQGLNELVTMISQHVFSDYVDCELLIPYDQGYIVSYFNENATVHAVDYVENGTKISVNCKQKDYNRYEEYVIK